VRWIPPRPCPCASAAPVRPHGRGVRPYRPVGVEQTLHWVGPQSSWACFRPLVGILTQNTGPSRVIWTNPVNITVQVGACAGLKAWTTSCKASCRWKACHNSTGLGSIASTTAPAVAPTPAPDVAACCLLLLVLLPAAAATPVAAPAAPAPAAPATPAPAAILSNGAPSTPCWCPRKAFVALGVLRRAFGAGAGAPQPEPGGEDKWRAVVFERLTGWRLRARPGAGSEGAGRGRNKCPRGRARCPRLLRLAAG